MILDRIATLGRFLVAGHPAESNRGSLTIPGLEKRVCVHFDRAGTPHVVAENEPDLFFAQGFVTARDRLSQLEAWRRLATGSLASMLGDRTLAQLVPGAPDIPLTKFDEWMAALALRSAARRALESTSTRGKLALGRLCAGINACVDLSLEHPPALHASLGVAPTAFDVLDLLAIARSAWILISPAARAALATNANWATFAATLEHALLPAQGFAGARAFEHSGIIAASLPFPAILPCPLYEIHLSAGAYDAIGASLPGIPGIVAGYNRSFAWSFVASGAPDAVETPALRLAIHEGGSEIDAFLAMMRGRGIEDVQGALRDLPGALSFACADAGGAALAHDAGFVVESGRPLDPARYDGLRRTRGDLVTAGAMTSRARRLREILGAAKDLDALVLGLSDTIDPAGLEMKARILAIPAASLSPLAAKAHAVLGEWDGKIVGSSAGAAILSGIDPGVDPAAALESWVAHLAGRLGQNPRNWRLDRLVRATRLSSPVFGGGIVPGRRISTLRAFAGRRPGARMLRRPIVGDATLAAPSAYRFVAEIGPDGAHGRAALFGGSSADPLSRHCDDQRPAAMHETSLRIPKVEPLVLEPPASEIPSTGAVLPLLEGRGA